MPRSRTAASGGRSNPLLDADSGAGAVPLSRVSQKELDTAAQRRQQQARDAAARMLRTGGSNLEA